MMGSYVLQMTQRNELGKNTVRILSILSSHGYKIPIVRPTEGFDALFKKEDVPIAI